MLLDLLLVAGSGFRRHLAPAVLAAALLLGAALGLVQRALPPADSALLPGPATHATPWLAAPLGVLVVALVAARAGGRERARLAATPLPSLAWSAGVLFGGVVAAGVLLALALGGARLAQQGAARESLRAGLAESAPGAWRFELPAGSSGPFPVEVDVALPFGGAGELRWTVERGGARAEGRTPVDTEGRVRFGLPDLSPARGNLYLRLRAHDGLVLGRAPPRLQLGEEPRATVGVGLTHDARRRLLVAVLVTLAAGCAFGRASACLAGLLALGPQLPGDAVSVGLALVALLAFATLATSLRRRTLLA